ncbi:MAG TPA: efflux RND transporter permease subunit [Gemmatimonadaceae bacterium]|nr:efflux RND transporter permease subunit [Gemmatimonadaceae bacterium]
MIRLSIKRPVAISMVYVAAALLGVAAWRNIPLELLPDTRLPQLSITAVWPGASPEATEALLTSPLEGAVQQVRGVVKVESTSSDQGGSGLAQLTVQFAPETDMDFARLELAERLSALREELPAAASSPRVEQYVPEAFQQQTQPFLSYDVTGPYTLAALRTYVDETIVPDVQQLDGVANVTVNGGLRPVVRIVLDPQRIAALRLSPAMVRERVTQLDLVREAGVARDEITGLERTVTIREHARDVGDIASAVLLSGGGRLVRVRDVATVSAGYEDPDSYFRIDGRPALSFEVHRQPRSNALRVSDRVKGALATLSSQAPPGVRLILANDESRAIRLQLTDLRHRALISAVVVFVVLLVSLRSLRSAGVVFATIAFSILIALNLLYFAHYSLNVLTLMGLAMGFGLIVDNAIVVLENIHRRVRGGEAPEAAAEHGSREVVVAILASTLTTVVVFIPFMYLQGELRAYYVPMAVAVGVSLLASLFVAFSFIPAVSRRVLAAVRRAPARRSPVALGAMPARARWLWRRDLHGSLVATTLRWPWVTVGVALVMLVGSGWLFQKHVVRGFLWRNFYGEDTYLSVQIQLPRGAQLARTNELTTYFEQRLHELPEVDRFVSHVYPQYALIRVTFPDSLERTAVPIAIKEQLTAFGNLFGGAEVRVYGYGPSFYGGGGSAPNYSIKILGYNYETVRDIAEELGRRLTRFSRIRDVDVNASGEFYERDRATEMALHIDRARMAMHGLTARDVVGQVAAAVNGRAAGEVLPVGGQEVTLSIKRAGFDSLDVQGLENLLIPGRGAPVRLGDVARVEERNVLGRIVREDQQYQRRVAYEFRGPAKLGDRVRDAVVASMRLPEGYTIDVHDQFRWSTEEQQQLYGVLAVALVLIYMVTAALFESAKQPLCVLLTVPMALIGVFLIFYLGHASFTREAYIGVIMMGGIVVNNAILLVDRVNQLRRDHGRPLREAILEGTRQRVRPILMTSACTVLGLLPLVLFSPTADANIWNALGFSLIGGLTSSTLLVLTVTPALYLLFERRGEGRRMSAKNRSQNS